MTQEEKELLLKDLCARLPYWVKVTWDGKHPITVTHHIYCAIASGDNKPPKIFLRPLSSMTEEENEEYEMLQTYPGFKTNHTNLTDMYDWLNKHHFDYRGLIEKGLALEAKEGIYEKKKA